jgi:hypothetical protein
LYEVPNDDSGSAGILYKVAVFPTRGSVPGADPKCAIAGDDEGTNPIIWWNKRQAATKGRKRAAQARSKQTASA